MMILPTMKGLGLVGAAGSYLAQVLADSPLVYWRLGETSGIIAADASENSRNGAYLPSTDGVWTGGTLGVSGATSAQAAYFAGSGGNVLSESVLPDLPIWTVECWLKRDGNQIATGGSLPCVVTDIFSIVSNQINYFLCFGLAAFLGDTNAGPNDLSIGWYDGAFFLAPPIAIPDGSWTHVVGTYDGEYLIAYLNGVEATRANITSSPATSGQGFRVGCRWDVDSFPDYFIGAISDVAIYNTALSSGRIAAHYAAR